MATKLSFLFIILGFITSLFMSAHIPAPHWRTHFFEKSKIVTSKVFKHENDKLKVTFLTNCLLGFYETVNNEETGAIENDASGLLTEIMNIYAKENKIPAEFYNLSRPSTGVRDFIFYFYHLIKFSDTDLIFYSLDWGSLSPAQMSDPASTIEMLHILSLIKNEYPMLSEQIKGLEKAILSLKDTRDALNIYTTSFNRLIHPQSLTVPRYDIEGTHSYWYDETPKTLDLIQSRIGIYWPDSILKLRNNLQTVGLWYQYLVYHLKGGDSIYFQQLHSSFLKNLNVGIENYTNTNLDAPFVKPHADKYFDSESLEFYQNWLELMYSLAKLEGKKLIYLFPPNMTISEKHYSLYLKPTYVDLVSKIASQYQQPVLDLTLEDILTPNDIIYRSNLITYNLNKDSKAQYKLIRTPNIVGKVKLAEYFLNYLFTENYLKNGPKDFILRYSTQIKGEPFELKLIEAKQVVDQDKQTIFEKWNSRLGDRHTSFFNVNAISKEEYFNENIYRGILDTEIEWLKGGGTFNYVCRPTQYPCKPRNFNFKLMYNLSSF